MKADSESRYPRWTPRQRESDEMNMRKNEETFAEVTGALPETKRKKEVKAEWFTAGGKVKIIAQVLGFLVLVNVVGNFLINIPNINRFVRSSGDRNNYQHSIDRFRPKQAIASSVTAFSAHPQGN